MHGVAYAFAPEGLYISAGFNASTLLLSAMGSGRRWTVRDRFGNEVYLTDERWEHIIDGHPEMTGYEDALRDTIRLGQRRQEQLAPQKYRYARDFPDLPMGNTHVVAVVLFRFDESDDGRPVPNNYEVTAFQKQIG